MATQYLWIPFSIDILTGSSASDSECAPPANEAAFGDIYDAFSLKSVITLWATCFDPSANRNEHPLATSTSSISSDTTAVSTNEDKSIRAYVGAMPLLPASFRAGAGAILALPPHMPHRCLNAYLGAELSVRRLNDVHGWLWMVGLPIPPRGFHVQRLKGREIVVCERTDLHLVWQPRRIFVKPLPRYLLVAEFWRQHLGAGSYVVCPDDGTSGNSAEWDASAAMSAGEEKLELYRCALGFLLSYVALIAHESDFRIAKDLNLIPEEVTWVRWVDFVNDLFQSQSEHCQHRFKRTGSVATIGATNSHGCPRSMWPSDQLAPLTSLVNKRYIYGELRLSRLNLIYRFGRGKLLRGYAGSIGDIDGRGRSVSSSDFVRRHLKSLITLFAYATIVLSAMQVGLATTHARNNWLFQGAAYVFALSAIVAPMLFLAATVVVLMILMCYYTANTMAFRRRRFAVLRAARRSEVTEQVGPATGGKQCLYVNDNDYEGMWLRNKQMV